VTPRKKKAKKKKKEPEPVQATLDEVIEPAAESKSPTTKTKRKSARAAKTAKSTKVPKTDTSKSKKSSRRSTESARPKSSGKGQSLESLPGVGKKTRERLIEAGYDTVEKIAKARSAPLAKKVSGLSKDDAQEMIAAAKKQLKESKAPHPPEEVPPEVTGPPLTSLPGVGKKLAARLVDAGYDSVARLSRARPDKVAAAVSGLSVERASEIVSSAKEMVQQIQISSITGETKSKPAAKKVAAAKPAAKKAKSTERTKTEKEKVASKKRAKKTKTSAPVRKRKPAPVVQPRKKPIRKESGLPVPAAVTKLTEELRRKWREAEQRIEAGEVTQETVEVVALTREETLERLVEEAMEILNETMTTGRPAFEIPSRSGDNIVWDEVRDLLLLGMKTISRPYHSLASVVDATRTARVMEIVFQLLRSNLHATKREIYYSDVNLFRDQKYSDKIIEDVASMLQTTRDSIHVVASARGSAMGRVIIRDGGDLIDLTKMGTGGWAITPFLDQVEIVESDAEFIILSEKDAAVMRLAESKYWNRQPCIVLTGKGSGDMATRAFLKRLVKELEIPAFALVDSDPYGHYIYSVFLRGSKRLSYESPFIATPELKLLGVLSRDLDAYNIPKAVRIPMEPADIKRVKDMLKEPFVQSNKEWVEDLKLMLRLKEKAEIQAFASHSFEFLTDEYIPTKLETGDWI